MIDVEIAAANEPDYLPFVHDGDAVRKGEQLIEIFGDQQDGTAQFTLLQQELLDTLDRADIEPAGGLHSNDHAWCAGEFAGEDQLL